MRKENNGQCREKNEKLCKVKACRKVNLHLWKYTHARTPLPPFLFAFQWPPPPPPSSTNVHFEWPLSKLDQASKMSYLGVSYSYVTTRDLLQWSKVLFENHRFWSLLSWGTEVGRVHSLTWHINIKGLRFKGVSLIFKAAKLLNFTELALNLKFTRFFLFSKQN